jgi:hypothetical protein
MDAGKAHLERAPATFVVTSENAKMARQDRQAIFL